MVHCDTWVQDILNIAYTYISLLASYHYICIYAVHIDTALNIWGPSNYFQANRLPTVIVWICHWTHLLLLLFHYNKVMLRKKSSLACNSTECRKSIPPDQMGLSLCSAGEVPIWRKIQLLVATPSISNINAKILTSDRLTKILFTWGKTDKVAPFPCSFLHQPSRQFQRASSIIQVHSIWLQHFFVMPFASPGYRINWNNSELANRHSRYQLASSTPFQKSSWHI